MEMFDRNKEEERKRGREKIRREDAKEKEKKRKEKKELWYKSRYERDIELEIENW